MKREKEAEEEVKKKKAVASPIFVDRCRDLGGAGDCLGAFQRDDGRRTTLLSNNAIPLAGPFTFLPNEPPLAS